MSAWNYPGARWWEFDFHAHTPASNDFKDKCQITPESWLRKFMDKGIDCVAIADHNSGGWIDELMQKLQELKQDQPEWYRPLYLFPGVEISANGGVHILAIFGCNKNKSDINQLLGTVDYRGAKGGSDEVTRKSITEVVDAIAERGGIAIPAHVDGEKGLFKTMSGESLGQVLDNPNIYGMELWDSNYQKPRLYIDRKLQWTEVKGSDTHDFEGDTFGDFTWIKMDEPSIEGLKLALIDGAVSINRNMDEDPNHHAEYLIEEIELKEAKYMGRPEVLTCRFNPFLNTIIGGRGSGKSTLLEFIRLVLRRDQEIPEPLKEESNKYFQVGGDNLLLDKSRLRLIYRKGDTRYRLNWSAEADEPSLQENKNNTWEDIPGEIRSLFPVRIYSQKQIFELAKNPRALIDIIDDAPEIDYHTIDKQHREFVNQYKQIGQRLQELNEKIAEGNRLRGKSDDLIRQIERIEESGHKAVLQNYRKRQQQLNEIENLESDWQAMSQQLLEMQDDVVPASLEEDNFAEHLDILSALKETNEKWQAISNKLNDLVKEAQSVVENWRKNKDQADWMQIIRTDMAQYEQLRTQLEQQGIDPKKYPLLLQQQKSIQKELEEISGYQSRKAELEAEKQTVFEQIVENRKELSRRRRNFLTQILQNNPSVNIEIKPFGEGWDSIERDIRRILQCPDRFDRDIEHLKDVYHDGSNQKVEELKQAIQKVRSQEKYAQDARFTRHLESLPQESIDDFILWFPGDDLKITFGPKNQQIEQGSPGQKTAALLAFILSYGNEPLLLDQPEDDLDNELIYELIVEQLREIKSKRQIIVVTHNANIVVNGDAELVLPLQVANGQTRISSRASIQDERIRKRICDILEGGQQAFEQRYKRIHLEKDNA